MDTTTQIYLKIMLKGGGSVEGDSSAAGYEGQIDIDSFSFSVSAKPQAVKGTGAKPKQWSFPNMVGRDSPKVDSALESGRETACG